MLGAIIGDIIGSPYEFGAEKTKNFPLFLPGCRPTDDSIMTVAVGCACVEADINDEQDFKQTLVEKMRAIGLQYMDAGYGERFFQWLTQGEEAPYGSNANGSAMRVSPVAWAADTLEDVQRLARWSAEITHDHPEGIRGAEAVATAIFLARTGADKERIRQYLQQHYYDLDFTIEQIRPTYRYSMSCENSVPQAIVSFLDGTDFEDCIRNAVSLGGDGDTQACIAGAIAEAFYGIPENIREQAMEYMDDELTEYYLSYAEELYP